MRPTPERQLDPPADLYPDTCPHGQADTEPCPDCDDDRDEPHPPVVCAFCGAEIPEDDGDTDHEEPVAFGCCDGCAFSLEESDD